MSKLNLLESALNNFHRRQHGLNILFAGLDKAPRTLWEKWQKTSQSDEEVRGIHQATDKASCWGFICGFNGLVAFDFDWPWVYRFWQKWSGQRGCTLTVKTPNGGYRPYFLVNHPTTDMTFKESLHCEIKGPGQFAVHEGEARREDGSMGKYELSLDVPISRDDKIVEETVKFLKGLSQRYSFLQWPCFKKYFSKKTVADLPHEARLLLADVMVHSNFEQGEVLNFFEDQPNFNEFKTLYQTRYTKRRVKRGLKPPRCLSIRRMLDWSEKGCEGCVRKQVAQIGKLEVSHDKEVEVVKTPFVELSDGRLAEQGYDGSKVYYLVYNPKTDKITKEDFVIDCEIRFEPIMDDDVENGRVLFPSEAVEYGSDEKLWTRVKNFIDYWHEETNHKERQLDVAYVFDSYIAFGKKCLGLIPIIGIRRKLGYLGRGKTAAAQSVGAICYRGFYIAGCGTDAAIRNMFNKWRGTAIIDEADFSRTDLYATMIKILNIGIDAQFGWHVKCDEEDSSKTVASYVFGPKILATRTRFRDPALESKMLTSRARANVKPKPLYRWNKFNQQAQELRNQLIMWRFRHYHDLKAKIASGIEDPQIVKKVFGEDIDVPGRIKEIVVPLGLVADKKTKKIIMQAAQAHAKIVKSLDLEAQFEEQVREALLELKEEMEADPDEDLPKVAKLADLYMKGFLIFKFTQILEKMGLPSDAEPSERRSLSAKVSRVLADHEIETAQVRAGRAGRFQVVLIPAWHEFLTPSHKVEPPQPDQPSSQNSQKCFQIDWRPP